MRRALKFPLILIVLLLLFLGAGLVLLLTNEGYLKGTLEYSINKIISSSDLSVSDIQVGTLDTETLQIESLVIKTKLDDLSFKLKGLSIPLENVLRFSSANFQQEFTFLTEVDAQKLLPGSEFADLNTRLVWKGSKIKLDIFTKEAVIYGSKIKDISIDAEISPAGELITPRPINFSVKESNLGIIVKNIKGSFKVGPNKASLIDAKVRGDLLGGSAQLEAAEYRPAAAQNTSLLKLKEIDISKIFELYASENISGTGLLEATLPLTLTKGNIRINAGEFSSLGGGKIVVPLPGGSNNSDVDLASRALSNFVYRELKGKVELKTTGDLYLNFTLQGHNPDLNNGQPVNVSANVEENIPLLIKSIRLSQGVGLGKH